MYQDHSWTSEYTIARCLGSCSKTSNSASINCTAPSVSPQYGMVNRPCKHSASRLTSGWYYLYYSQIFPCFQGMHQMIYFQLLLPQPQYSSPLPSPSQSCSSYPSLWYLCVTKWIPRWQVCWRTQHCSACQHGWGSLVSSSVWNDTLSFLSEVYIGSLNLSLLLGLTSFLIIRMWFGKAVDDFNASIISQGQQGPKLIAATGNAFTSESTKTILFFFFWFKSN